MQFKNISINISINDNGVPKKALFKGYAYVDSGFLVGNIVGQNSKLTFKDYTLLSAFTLTGCPIAARTATPELNPWRYTNGEYRSIRKLESKLFEVNSTLESYSSGNQIDMHLKLCVAGEVPEVKLIQEPFQESIKQVDTGVFEGKFSCIFRMDANENILTKAFSRYELAVDKDFADVWRNITILGNGDDSNYQQVEQIDMFDSKSTADLDLASKKHANIDLNI